MSVILIAPTQVTGEHSKGYIEGILPELTVENLEEDFACSNSTWKDRTLTATFRAPFDILAVTNTPWKRKRPPELISGDLCL